MSLKSYLHVTLLETVQFLQFAFFCVMLLYILRLLLYYFAASLNKQERHQLKHLQAWMQYVIHLCLYAKMQFESRSGQKSVHFPWTLLLHQPLTWSTSLRIISYYFNTDSKHYLRLGNRNRIFHHYPLHWFITGWGGKGAFVRIVRSVLGSQLWNKFRQSDVVSKVIVHLFKEKERNKNGVYYPINCYLRRD